MVKNKKVGIIGAGWAGTSAYYKLKENNIDSVIFEKNDKVGGHSRSEKMEGVIYEPNGPHIFHTSNLEINNFVNKFGMVRPYKHRVKTRIYPDSLKGESILLSWPPQIEELKKLDEWKVIQKEINSLDSKPDTKNFKTYAISIMGKTLYSLFIEGYTIKQWDIEPDQLSYEFAPKRIDLRNDGNLNLFKDTWEYFHPGGSGEIIEKILLDAEVEKSIYIDIENVNEIFKDFDAIVITAPLDIFINSSKKLDWRGIKMESKFIQTENESDTITEAYQINHPSLNEPFTRTIETKHASGQLVNGSVVSQEYSYENIRHYPILTKDGSSKKLNESLKKEIQKNIKIPTYFCGRLANYQYINQDEAILQGFNSSFEIIKDIS